MAKRLMIWQISKFYVSLHRIAHSVSGHIEIKRRYVFCLYG